MTDDLGSMLQPIRLLIVDDHPLARKALTDILCDDSSLAIVGQASSGSETLQQIARTEPDVVLLDVRMPGLDGVATCQNIQAEFPSVRVIGMSVGPDPQDAVSMQRAGAVCCVVKADPESIVAAIRACMNRQQAA